MKRFVLVLAAITVVSVGLSQSGVEAGSGNQESALEQLKRATSGTQSTGKTFDGGPTPTDAYPKGNVTVPPVLEAKPVTPSISTHSAGGYGVDTSTSTEKGASTRPKGRK